jgi:hypothetical protein
MVDFVLSTMFAVIALWPENAPACAHFYRAVIGLSFSRTS